MHGECLVAVHRGNLALTLFHEPKWLHESVKAGTVVVTAHRTVIRGEYAVRDVGISGASVVTVSVAVAVLDQEMGRPAYWVARQPAVGEGPHLAPLDHRFRAGG